MSIQTLYRFFDRSGGLLYIGITMNPVSRWKQHRDDKPWWTEVGAITLEHHPDRRSVFEAEAAAIRAEHPKHNYMHNRGGLALVPKTKSDPDQWTFESERGGLRRQCDLYLYPELDCSSMVDDYWELDGEGQLEAYIQYLRRGYPQWLDADAVPIYWSVMSEQGGICEAAPFQRPPDNRYLFSEVGDFLTFFTWPYDAKTGEPLDWYRLPVINRRFPAFAEALHWTPSPLEPTCPLTSLIRSRNSTPPPNQKVRSFRASA